jgi:hypothetical protein
MEVSYEELFLQPEKYLKQIISFFGFEWSKEEISDAVRSNSPDMIWQSGFRPILIGGEHARRGRGEVVEPEGFFRRGLPGSWRGDLSWWIRFRIWLAARSEIRTAGYAWRFPL